MALKYCIILGVLILFYLKPGKAQLGILAERLLKSPIGKEMQSAVSTTNVQTKFPETQSKRESDDAQTEFTTIAYPGTEPEVLEPAEAVETTDIICSICSCASGVIDCNAKNIHSPFSLTDWEGVKSVSPTTVIMSNNPLVTVTMIAELPIQNLTLKACDIESIEDFAFSNLVDLAASDLSHNLLTSSTLSHRIFEGLHVPGEKPRQFSKMKILTLAYNDITALPPHLFMAMPDLTTLDLSGNPLEHIDQVTMTAMTNLDKLKELKLRSCLLESLPEGLLRRQRRLEHLDLADNKFTIIPSVISEAVNLSYLNLNKNFIVDFTEKTALSSLTKLKELHLCQLSKLQSISSGSLGGLEQLVDLRVCYNPHLSSIDADFLMWTDEDDIEKYPPLQKLYLNNNNLSVIDSNFLERWDQLTEADFTSNPYRCDCNAQWMVDVLVPLLNNDTEGNKTASNMFCKKPSELRGMSFLQLNAQSKIVTCPVSETLLSVSPNMAILFGIWIGIFTTFPFVLVTVLLWRKGFFARCQRRIMRRKKYYEGDEEDDAF